MQALADVCRHVAVEVVSAAERDSPDGQPSPAHHPHPVISEQHPPGEEAHLQSGGWDAEPTVSAPDATHASWLACGGARSNRRRVQHGPSVGHHTTAVLRMASAAQYAVSEGSAAAIGPSGGLADINLVQRSTVRIPSSLSPVAKHPRQPCHARRVFLHTAVSSLILSPASGPH